MNFGTNQFNYTYLANSHLISQVTTCGGAAKKVFTYEPNRDLPTEIAFKLSNNTLIAKRNYTFDAVGRVSARTQTRGTDTARNDSFGYNDRSELTSATLGTDDFAYSFDNIGNRMTAGELADEIAYSANNLNQYTAIEKNSGTPFVPTFDDDGNQLTVQTATGVWNVTYNAENRPITFTQGTTVIECKYDSMGRRFEKKVTANNVITFWQRYAYKGYLQIAAFNVLSVNETEVLSLATTTYWDPTEPTATRPLAFTDHTVATPTTYFYTHDLTKNVCEVLSRNGSAVAIVTEYDYTPFGAVTASNSTTPNTFTFSSEVLDPETSLIYYNYRHYNPIDGRWISRDLAEEAASRNMLYIFSSNRPFNLFDILGLITVRNTITIQSALNIWLFWIKFRINFNYDITVNTGVKTSDCPSKYPRNIKFIAELGAMQEGFGIAGKLGAEGDNFGALLTFQYGFKTYGNSLLAKIWNLEFVESKGFEAYADFQQFYPEVSLLGLPLAKCVCASASLKAEIEVSYGLSVTKTAAVAAAVAVIAGTGGGAATVASASPQIIQFVPAIKSAAAALFVIPAIFEE